MAENTAILSAVGITGLAWPLDTSHNTVTPLKSYYYYSKYLFPVFTLYTVLSCLELKREILRTITHSC
jgi:hypothetical protein